MFNAWKTRIYVYIHHSQYWNEKLLENFELSRAIKFNVFQTILDKTLETTCEVGGAGVKMCNVS